jgi:hypothetical protein|tara:strand:- start:582 stop:842 length:261 start_codon:yes stop_codon:yes gene_type:complete
MDYITTMIGDMFGSRLWIWTAIAGSIVGLAFSTYFKSTRMGLWLYSKFDGAVDFLVNRWGWTWFQQQPTRLDKIEERLASLEKKRR